MNGGFSGGVLSSAYAGQQKAVAVARLVLSASGSLTIAQREYPEPGIDAFREQHCLLVQSIPTHIPL